MEDNGSGVDGCDVKGVLGLDEEFLELGVPLEELDPLFLDFTEDGLGLAVVGDLLDGEEDRKELRLLIISSKTGGVALLEGDEGFFLIRDVPRRVPRRLRPDGIGLVATTAEADRRGLPRDGASPGKGITAEGLELASAEESPC